MVTQEKSAATPAKAGMKFSCLGLILNLIWIGLLAGGLYVAYDSWKLSTGGSNVSGTVVDMIESSDDDGTTYAPVVQYEVNGTTYSYQSSNYTNPPAYRVGQEVKMVYDGDHPDKARISNFFELWLIPLILIPLGLGDAAVTLFLVPMLSRSKTA